MSGLRCGRDLEGDGRYAITVGNPPVDQKRLAALINAEIAEVVRAIKDERECAGGRRS